MTTHYHYLTIEQRERLQAILQARLTELGAGLARLHTPDYGVCEVCGADIPYVRLESDPLVRRCAACAARPA
ncbi:MAG TPA: TraR/DksA C4-type zinc finger protein [Burkholderiales bacterium]|nr:TraR/DksA C4-type zinc finger protein [Burkholderiales bacterium]